MDLYLRRKYGVISGVIHDMRAGRWACITGLDQLLLYLDDVLDITADDRDSEKRRPELGEMSESFARIPSNDVKKLELRVTGCKYRTIQGNICSAEDGAPVALVFKSGLELVRRIHQLV